MNNQRHAGLAFSKERENCIVKPHLMISPSQMNKHADIEVRSVNLVTTNNMKTLGN